MTLIPFDAFTHLKDESWAIYRGTLCFDTHRIPVGGEFISIQSPRSTGSSQWLLTDWRVVQYIDPIQAKKRGNPSHLERGYRVVGDTVLDASATPETYKGSVLAFYEKYGECLFREYRVQGELV